MQSVKSYNVNFFQSHNRWTLELGGLGAKGARKKHYNHSTSHFYLPPNKDRTKAVAITRFVGHVARCVAIELPRRGQL